MSAQTMDYLSHFKTKYALKDCYNLFFVNGEFLDTLSSILPAGVEFQLVNAGYSLQVLSSAMVDKPLHCIYVSDAEKQPRMLEMRNQIYIQQDAKAELIEQFISMGEAELTHQITTEVTLASSAMLKHLKLILEGDVAQHVAHVEVIQEAGSQLEHAVFSMSGMKSCHELVVKMKGEDAISHLAGLYYGCKDHVVEQHLSVEHLHPHTTSTEYFKGVLAQQARGVFDGRIYVEKHADGTNAALSNKNVLLSETAEINTKPQLEIYADDVKCTHGATVGHLDESALFYMQSRGVEPVEARKLLLMAFAGDVLAKISFEPLRKKLESIVMTLFENNYV